MLPFHPASCIFCVQNEGKKNSGQIEPAHIVRIRVNHSHWMTDVRRLSTAESALTFDWVRNTQFLQEADSREALSLQVMPAVHFFCATAAIFGRTKNKCSQM